MGDDQTAGALFVIGGYNGLKSVQAWVKKLKLHSPCYLARAYSWRDAGTVGRDIVRLPPGKRLTLIGHSIGGGRAQLLVQILPAGTIDLLVTVAPFGPPAIDHELTRRKVGHWLNILPKPARDWRSLGRNVAAPLLLKWREQGIIPNASENYISNFAHHDFYKLMSDRCGAVEHGEYALWRHPDRSKLSG